MPEPVADIDAAAWSRNPHVIAASEDHSVIARGAYHRFLKIPVTADRRVCLARHRFLKRSAYQALGDRGFLEWLDAPPGAAPLADAIFFGGSSAHWHFLVDGVGTMLPMPARGARHLYVDAELSDGQVGFILAFAKAAGLPAFERVARLPGAAYRVENSVFPCARTLDRRAASIRATLGIGSSPTARGRRLFVLRTQTQRRVLRNQERLAALLQERFGFEPVDPAAMSLLDQVREFHDAVIIVGAHGSGLANALFAARPVCVVELYHSLMQPFYESLAYVLGARHVVVEGRAVAEADSRHDDADFEIDEGKLLRTVEAQLAMG